MTKVSVNEYNDSYIIYVEGHAGFSEYGSDIVCSAISAITYTLINSLKWAEDDGYLHIRTENICDGSANIEVEPYDFAKEKVETIIDTCLTGFTLIEEKYPDYINVSG